LYLSALYDMVSIMNEHETNRVPETVSPARVYAAPFLRVTFVVNQSSFMTVTGGGNVVPEDPGYWS